MVRMNHVMPAGACWCPKCNRPGTPNGEDDTTPPPAAVDPWAEVA